MKTNTLNAPVGLDDETLGLLVKELRRLTTDLARSIARQQVLPCLSSLAAMKPLQAILTETLSERILDSATTSDSAVSYPETFHGYV